MSPTRRLALLLALFFAVVACGGSGKQRPASALDPADWAGVQAQARGQHVRWWMYGGDERINRYVDSLVKPAAARLGVTLDRVPVTDTADAVQRALAERRSGSRAGTVDLIWINGNNFAQGKSVGLWLENWAPKLPHARLVDWTDPTISRDFGVPVDGQESPWSRAAFVFAADARRAPQPPPSFSALLDYARAHPGRVTYPAPPDFTGSAFVRLAVQQLGEDAAFRLLRQLKALQWRAGQAFPSSEAELNSLFGDGQVDFAMSYDPNFVSTGVRQGMFPRSTRPFVLGGATLQNVSYVTIPANAAHVAGALAVADLLLDPALQAAKADPDRLGIPTVLDLDRLSPDQRADFDRPGSATYALADFGRLLPELPPARVTAIDARWKREVLR